MARAAETLRHAEVDFTLVRSDRRTLGITVTGDGHTIVRAPLRVALPRVLAFVAERRPWIAAARARFAALPPRTAPPGFADGEVHLHLGRPYLLAVERGLRAGVRLDGDRMVLTLHRPDRTLARAALVKAWRRGQARAVYAERLAAMFPPFAARGFALPALTIRTLKRRWGSMSRDGRMTLSADLIRAPLDAIDYVIAHELCHLVHFDHGPGFKALMSCTMPDHARRRLLLEAALR